MSNSSLLPADVMKMLGTQHKMDNKEIVINYLVSEEGSVTLTDKQKELLHRWNAADDLMRSHRYTSKQVAFMLTKKFDYSIAAAWRDIDDARYVFGNSLKSNKKYLLALHVDRIEAAIVLAEQQGKKDTLPKLYEVYLKAIALLQDESKDNQAPTAIMFNITQNNTINLLPDSMTGNDAQRIAEDRLKAKGLNIGEIIPLG